jgi:hypothetical protein
MLQYIVYYINFMNKLVDDRYKLVVGYLSFKLEVGHLSFCHKEGIFSCKIAVSLL